VALIYLGKMFKYFTILIKRPTNSKQETPVPVCLLRKKLRVNMLTSAKTGKQNGDIRTRKTELGILTSLLY
jgi:hypothetical protein